MRFLYTEDIYLNEVVIVVSINNLKTKINRTKQIWKMYNAEDGHKHI